MSDILVNRFPNTIVKASNIFEIDAQAFYCDCWNEKETAVFLGSSGVGKSTLINMLLNSEVIKTSSIRGYDGKGRHTTTARHMYSITGGRIVIDTPGLRSVGISPDSNTIQELFPEIYELEGECKFTNCSHVSEPGCAIRNALEKEELEYDRYLRYLKLIGDEHKRSIFLSGKSHEKEKLAKELKKSKSK